MWSILKPYEEHPDYRWVLRWQLEEEEVVVRQSPASMDMNTEGESYEVKAVTRWQPMKIKQTEKTSYML
jgi:hypothetical protein